MFEGFDTGSPWSDEDDQPEPPPPPWYIQVLILVTLAAIVWAIYEGVKTVNKDKKWNLWADKWLSGENRSITAADAADRNEFNAQLINIIEEILGKTYSKE